MKAIVVKSPAKLNVYLEVINKRPDGYHNIKTIFQRINLFDDIRLQPNKLGKIVIRCNNTMVPKGPSNIVHKAARMLVGNGPMPFGVSITINKRIPVAAGLAGGSSNAASALLGLNRLWRLNLKRVQLIEYAKRLGSDVAFFLYDCRWALGTQRGEKIERLNIDQKLWHILVVPRVRLLSSRIYGGLKLSLTKKMDNASILIHNLKKGNILGISGLLRNDLETEILRVCPRLKKLKQSLKSLNCHGVMVSGSGPSVFGIVSDKRQAMALSRILKKRFKQVFVVGSF